MSRAPLRFLLTLLALWVGVRAAILLPGWPEEMVAVTTAAAEPGPAAAAVAPSRPARIDTPGPIGAEVARKGLPPSPAAGSRARPAGLTPVARIALTRTRAPTPAPHAGGSPGPAPTPQAVALAPPLQMAASPSRWSASAWLLIRDESGGGTLAPGGTLGGSQAGARLTYRLGGGFALSARAYVPLRAMAGAEAAAGLDWRPVRTLPLNLLAERRQRLGREGRNAFALTLYGGASRDLAPRLRLDAYGQAGVVGLRARDVFADGAVRLTRRAGPVEIGAGAWGAAQPGAARLDAGPSLSWRLPVPDSNLRLQADWRFRVADDAAPRSGPALTLAADF